MLPPVISIVVLEKSRPRRVVLARGSLQKPVGCGLVIMNGRSCGHRHGLGDIGHSEPALFQDVIFSSPIPTGLHLAHTTRIAHTRIKRDSRRFACGEARP